MLPKPQLLKGLVLGAVVLGMATPNTQAQTADRKTAIGINVSLEQYRGNMGSDFWDLGSPKEFRVGGGGHRVSGVLSQAKQWLSRP